jgi:cell division septum initiation protein DivIVA
VARLRPDQISTAGLEKRLGRYAAEPVEKLLENLRISYEELSDEHAAARKAATDMSEELERYRKLEHQLSEVLVLAEQAAAERRDQAEHEIEAMVERARQEAQNIVLDATAERDQIRAEVTALEQRARELETSYRAFLLAALELVATEREERNRSPEARHLAAEDQASSRSDPVQTASQLRSRMS